MIEINLIPDIKRDYLAARRTRSLVITGSLIAGAGAIAVVVLLAVNIFVVQAVRSTALDNGIKSEYEKLMEKDGLASAVTVHDQLRRLQELQGESTVNSRIFSMLDVIAGGSSNVSISKTVVDTEDSTILLEAQSTEGYAALERFKKTINATTLRSSQATGGEDGPEVDEVKLATDLVDSERSLGEDAQGNIVLRFTVQFTYGEKLFSNEIDELQIVGPDRTNATDSFTSVPDTLFTNRLGEE